MKSSHRLAVCALHFLFCLLVPSLLHAASMTDWPQLQFTTIASGLSFPTDIAHGGDGSGRLFVTEQRGRVIVVQTNGSPNQTFLDISARVAFFPGGQDGLLGVAFPPDFGAKRCFYVYYNEIESHFNRLSRFHVATNSEVADPATEEIILEIPQRGAYLNGGQLVFGLDGFLYLGVGDTGFSPNVPNSAQDPASYRGKILRLDVTSCTNGYSIPPANPYIGRVGYLPEIWALGLRNPFRFSFDRLTGDFFSCDVGQNTWEEIDFKPAALAPGQNYGWPIKEGNHDYAIQGGVELGPLTAPIVEYLHFANSAVVGGYVYRGPPSPRLDGLYFFGDFVTGQIWAAKHEGQNWVNQLVSQTPYFISTFGEDDDGHLYLANYLSGKVYRLEDNAQAAPVTFSPSGGTVRTDSVSLSSLSPDVTIHYTTNGSDPTEMTPAIASGGAVAIADGMTIRAQAFRGGLLPSIVTGATFTLRVATPGFLPAQGPITNGTKVAISSSTSGASIRYTLDGTEPGVASPIYSGAVAINQDTPLKARGFKPGFNDSLTGSFAQSALRIDAVHFDASAGNAALSWQSVTGKTYQVQFSDDFTSWYNISKLLSGNGQPLSQTNVVQYPLPQRRYFRILSEDL